MKKFGLIVLSLCLLATGAMITISKSQAAGTAKWKAVILPGGNLAGDPNRYQSALGGWVYDDAESAVDAYATLGFMSGGTFWTIFRTWIYYPEKVNILGVEPPTSLVQDTQTPGLVYNGYPPSGQTSLIDFLNGPHPYDNRYLINIAFFGPRVSTKTEAEWDNKPVGWTLQGVVFIEISNITSGDCYTCPVTNYHDIEVRSHDAWLIKESPTSYLVRMDTDFNNPARDIGSPPWTIFTTKDYILNSYCICVPRTSRKGVYYVKEPRYPEVARAPMKFEIRYIKY